MFIGEDLPPKINTLAFNARKLVREQVFYRTWLARGIVHVVRREGLAAIEVPSITELQRIAQEEREGITY